MTCAHEEVLVDCLHPHGDLSGVRVGDLQASPASQSRPVMTLTRARCAACGRALSRRELRARIAPGGDLFDGRFVWS